MLNKCQKQTLYIRQLEVKPERNTIRQAGIRASRYKRGRIKT